MTTLELIGGIALILVSVIVIVVVVMQESKQAGVAVMGGQADSYLSKNRGKTLESKLVTITKFLTVIFFITVIIMNIIIRNNTDVATSDNLLSSEPSITTDIFDEVVFESDETTAETEVDETTAETEVDETDSEEVEVSE